MSNRSLDSLSQLLHASGRVKIDNETEFGRMDKAIDNLSDELTAAMAKYNKQLVASDGIKYFDRSDDSDVKWLMMLDKYYDILAKTNRDIVIAFIDGRDGRAMLYALLDHTDDDETRKIKRLVARVDQMRDRIVAGNLRLPLSICRDMKVIQSTDLVQEANIMLMKAALRYDINSGNKFSTYATFWIKNGIKTALTRRRAEATIDMPTNALEYLSRYYKAKTEVEQVLQRRASLEEVCELASLDVQQVREFLIARTPTASLDATTSDEGQKQLHELIADPSTDDSDAALTNDRRGEALAQALMTLNDRERVIIALRFGLHDGREWSLHEVGQTFNPPLIYERVRQLQEIGVGKIKRSGALMSALHETL